MDLVSETMQGGFCVDTVRHPNPGFYIMKEIWKDIEGYEDLYQISNRGRARSLSRYMSIPKNNHSKKHRKFHKGGILETNKPGNRGYAALALYYNAKMSKRIVVHRLVAKAFIPNPKDKPQINHKDGNKLNNHVNNLEWVTCSENHYHAYSMGFRSHLVGNNAPNNKLMEPQVLEIKKLKGKYSGRIIGRMFNISQQHVSRIHSNQAWKHLA